jgi:hypothetical protein
LTTLKEYTDDFSVKNLMGCLFAIALFFFFNHVLTNLFLKTIVPLVVDLRDDKLSSYIAVAVTLAVCFFFIYRSWKYKTYPTVNSLIRLLAIGLIYAIFIRLNNAYKFYSLFNSNIYFSDLFVFVIIICSSRYRHYNFSQSIIKEEGFIIDAPEKDNKQSGAIFAKAIADKLLNTASESAFAVAITAAWGKGKTSFLLQIRENLKDKDVIIIEFNPWKNEGGKKNIAHFFDELREKLKNYDTSVSGEIKSYATKLISSYNSEIAKAMDETFSVAGDGSSLSSQFNYLNNIIKTIGKKIFVFIDDLDRLTAEELIEIMRLIRNTADFANMFFIAAFDHNYVLNSLGKSHVLNNKEDFLQKIFQLEISLTPIAKGLIRLQLQQHLKLVSMPPEEQQRFREVFNELSIIQKQDEINAIINKNAGGLLEQLLETIRDVKRFSNSFLLAYGWVKNEVDLFDLFLLEMIKYRFNSLYAQIASQYIIEHSDEGKSETVFKINTDRLESLLNPSTDINIPPLKKDLARQVVNLLFDKTRNRTRRSVYYAVNFAVYFNYELADLELLRKFADFKQRTEEELARFISAETGEVNAEVLENIKGTIFNKEEDFKKLFRVLFIPTNDQNRVLFEDAVHFIMMDQQRIVTNHFGAWDLFIEFILSILKDKQLDILLRSSTAFDLLYPKLSTSKNLGLLFPSTELKEIIFQCFKEYYDANQRLDPHIFTLYLRNYESIDPQTKEVALTAKANDLMNVIVKRFPLDYLKNFLRYYSTEQTAYVGDPFAPQIFGDWPNFGKWLLSLPDDHFYIIETKTFFRYYTDAQYKPIPFQRGLLEIVSDTSTIFTGSQNYRDIQQNTPAVICNNEKKLKIKAEIPVLKYSFWIAHSDNIGHNERVSGGEYFFQKEFNLAADSENLIVENALMFFLVDNQAQINLNDRFTSTKLVGFEAKDLQRVSLTNAVLGKNTMKFRIINDPYEEAKIRQHPAWNPYEFIYLLRINIDYNKFIESSNSNSHSADLK